MAETSIVKVQPARVRLALKPLDRKTDHRIAAYLEPTGDLGVLFEKRIEIGSSTTIVKYWKIARAVVEVHNGSTGLLEMTAGTPFLLQGVRRVNWGPPTKPRQKMAQEIKATGGVTIDWGEKLEKGIAWFPTYPLGNNIGLISVSPVTTLATLAKEMGGKIAEVYMPEEKKPS